MKQELLIKADTVALALEQACQQLGVSQDALSYEVVQEPKKGLFGKIKEQAQVKVTCEQPEQPKTDAGEDAKISLATEYLKGVLDKMGLTEVEMTVEREENNVRIVIEGDKVGVAIGRRGETLDSLQYLTSLVANRQGGEYVRFVIDSGNFRAKREETLKNLASKIARATLKSGRSSTLEPMNPYERRIIHSVISKIDGVYSKSIGEEPNRRIVVVSENPRRQSGSGSKGRDRDRDSRPRKPQRGRYNSNQEYVIPKDVDNQPSTYDFEKEFLKSEKKDTKLYSKIEFDS